MVILLTMKILILAMIGVLKHDFNNMRYKQFNIEKLVKYFPNPADVDNWIMLNTLRILRNDSNKSHIDAVKISIDQLSMDVNTDWYDELRFSLEDLSIKSADELNKQQKEFVIKNVTPHLLNLLLSNTPVHAIY